MAGRSVRMDMAHKRSVILVVIVTLALAVFLSVAIIRLNRENKILMNNNQVLDEQITEEQTKKESLKAQDGKGLTKEEAEQIARDRFNLVYPDEIILTPED